MAMVPQLAAKLSMPRFKWGQSKESIYLSIIVRELDTGTVAVSLPTSGELTFRAKTTKGEEYGLDLELREDVKVEEPLKWEIAARPDKWGTAVFLILNKAHQHRWDLLVSDMKKYKKHVDKDWTREDQKLEPDEELPYAEDNSQYVTALTGKNMQKTVEKFSTVLVNVRYPWCSQCKSQDESFIKAAKTAKAKGKKDKQWKKVAFAVLDAREERKLARELGAKCDHSCEYRVFTGPTEEPAIFKAQWSDLELLNQLTKYLHPAVQVLKDASEVEAIKSTNTTCLGMFTSDSSPEYAIFKKVAGTMRGELIFAAVFDSGITASKSELWPHKQNFSFKYEGEWAGNGSALHDWIKPRSIPLLQGYDWQLRETYEKLGLPLAKVWINEEDKNPSFEKIVRHVVRKVAKRFIGKIAFVELKKSTYSYELRDFGLNQPEVYPAFGIASNSSYNAIKYGFEVTDKVAESAESFWKDADQAISKLSAFCEEVLAGTWPQAHESGPVQTNWTEGKLKKLAWKSYNEIRSPEKPVLLEIHGKYRQEHERKAKEAEHLASTVHESEAGKSFVVASLDTSDNYVPPEDFKRDKYSSDTEWYWVTKGSDPLHPTVKKLMKPKKDAPIKNVIEFAGKMLGADALNVEDAISKFEKLMKDDPPPAAPKAMDPITMDGMGKGKTGLEGLGDMGGMGGMMGDMGGMGGLGDMGGMGDMAGLGDMAGMGKGEL